VPEQNHTECRIYRKPDILLGKYILDESRDSITVGVSEHCDISLAEFKKDLPNVKDAHFAIARQETAWIAINPEKEGDLNDVSGKSVSCVPLSHGMKLFFGNCYIIFSSQRPLSSYSISFSSKEPAPQIFQLCIGDNIIGSTDDSEIKPAGLPENTKILSVSAGDDIPVIMPLCSEIENSVGKKLIGKSLAESFERYRYKDMEFEILKSGAPMLDIPNRDKFRSGIINFFILMAVVANIIILGMLFTAGKSKAPASSSMDSIPRKQELLNQASSFMQKGDLLLAFKAISPISKSDNAYFKELHEALSTEINAMELLDFHRRKLKAIENLLIDPLPDSEEKAPIANLRLYTLYITSAKREIEDEMAKISKYECRQFDLKASSMFLRKAPAVIVNIKIVLGYFENAMSLVQACEKEDWDKAIEILKALSESFKKDKLEALSSKCEEIFREVETIQKIVNMKKHLESSDLTELDLDDSKAQISKFKIDISEIGKYDPNSAKGLLKDLSESEETISSAGKIRETYRSWKNNPENIEALALLVKFLSGLRTGMNPDMKDKTPPTIVHVGREIKEFVDGKVTGLPEDITPEALKKCIEAENLILTVSALQDDFNHGAVYDKMEIIKKGLNKKCAGLYARYDSARQNSPEEADKILMEIFENAPSDSRYFTWAEKELKKIKQ